MITFRDSGVMVQIHPAMDPILLPNRQLDHRPVSKIDTNPSGFFMDKLFNVLNCAATLCLTEVL